jgi:ribonuclease HI
VKYYLVDITTKNPRAFWIENNNIPYEKQVVPPRKDRNYAAIVYKNCYFDSSNIHLLEENLPDYICFDDITTDNLHKSDVYTIFSDGGSFNNGYKDNTKPMFASTSTFIIKNGKEEIWNSSKPLDDKTNNFAEVTAGIDGLKYILKEIDTKDDKPLVIMSSDSQYLMKGINSWLDNWIKRGWKNNEGKPTPNKKEWQFIKKCLDNRDDFKCILTCWIRGHELKEGNIYSEYNNKCDIQCNEALNILLEKYDLPLRKV